MSLEELLALAQDEQIDIVSFDLDSREALAIMDTSGYCHVAIDPHKATTSADLKTKVAHELGHCATGSLYQLQTSKSMRHWCETRADKWAIRHLIPRAELEAAVAKGYTHVWELAEIFGVTEAMMRKAMTFYQTGHIE